MLLLTPFQTFSVVTYDDAYTNDSNIADTDGVFATATPTSFTGGSISYHGNTYGTGYLSASHSVPLPGATLQTDVVSLVTNGVNTSGDPLTVDMLFDGEIWYLHNSTQQGEIDVTFDFQSSPSTLPDGSVVTRIDIQFVHKWDGTTYSLDSISWRFQYQPPTGTEKMIDHLMVAAGSSYTLNPGNRVGTNFTGTNHPLLSCTLTVLANTGATGTAVAKVWASSGTVGSTFVGAGANPLVTSDGINVASLPTSGTTKTTFNFSGANIFSPVSGVKYCVTVEFTGTGTITAKINTDIFPANYDLVDYGVTTAGAWTNDSASGCLPFILSGPDLVKGSMIAMFL